MSLGANYSSAARSRTRSICSATWWRTGTTSCADASSAGDDRYYRFRTVEVTVPLRNVMAAPAS